MLQISNLTFGYQSPLFSDLNLSLQMGKVTGLLGKNGAGKTTLIKIICGLLSPQEGSLNVLGYEPIARDTKFLSQIFFIPENVELPDLNAEQMAKFCGILYSKFKKETYFENLKRLHVPLNSSLSKLSFGQKRKALLAFALATSPTLLILDEPTNGFDISSQITLRELIVENVDPSRGIIISTHHIQEFSLLLDDVLILDEGKIILHKTTDELSHEFSPLNLENVFMQATGEKPKENLT